MFPPARLHTKRLLLRCPELADAESFFEWSRDPDFMRYLAWRPSANVEDVRRFIESRLDNWSAGEGPRPWMITPSGGADPMGYLAFVHQGHQVELAYALGHEHWGQGYASEAVKAVSEAALGDERIFRVCAVCDVVHAASARVLEKAGMTREGIARRSIIEPHLSSEPRDAVVYAVVR